MKVTDKSIASLAARARVSSKVWGSARAGAAQSPSTRSAASGQGRSTGHGQQGRRKRRGKGTAGRRRTTETAVPKRMIMRILDNRRVHLAA